jgi:glucosamine-phosphate N-acetyltransferase
MIRSIEYQDFYKSYMELINTFTRKPTVITYDLFCKELDKIRQQNAYIFVIEKNEIIIGTLKVIIEHKLHNNLRPVGHIEDVVVHELYRKQGLGTLFIEHAKRVCADHNCYKIVLACNKDNIDFYKHSNFIEKGAEMTIYLE